MPTEESLVHDRKEREEMMMAVEVSFNKLLSILNSYKKNKLTKNKVTSLIQENQKNLEKL